MLLIFYVSEGPPSSCRDTDRPPYGKQSSFAHAWVFIECSVDGLGQAYCCVLPGAAGNSWEDLSRKFERGQTFWDLGRKNVFGLNWRPTFGAILCVVAKGGSGRWKAVLAFPVRQGVGLVEGQSNTREVEIQPTTCTFPPSFCVALVTLMAFLGCWRGRGYHWSATRWGGGTSAEVSREVAGRRF